MTSHRLADLAKTVRSKNAGPFFLTFDVIFEDAPTYKALRDSEAINHATFAEVMGIKADEIVELVHYDPACSVKITVRRRISSGGVGDTDVYGCQQHAALMEMLVDI